MANEEAPRRSRLKPGDKTRIMPVWPSSRQDTTVSPAQPGQPRQPGQPAQPGGPGQPGQSRTQGQPRRAPRNAAERAYEEYSAGRPGQNRPLQTRPGQGRVGYPPPPPRPGTPPQRSGWSPRRIRRLLTTIVVLAVVVYPALLGLVAWSSFNSVDALGGSQRSADTPGRTILIVGSDARDELTPEERNKLHTGKAVGQRTDTIMLMHRPAGSGPTVLISVPRDSYVPIPGHGRNKINAAFAIGGPQLLVQTLESVTGLHIDSYVETGFAGYADLVDAVGGIDVCVKRDMNDSRAHINLKAGCQSMDGTTALGYARARYSDPRGDLGRVERQRQVLASIMHKVASPSVLLNPFRSFPAASAGGKALTVDGTPWATLQFLLGMRAATGDGGVSLTVPISNPSLQTSAGEAVQWDRGEAIKLFEAIQRDDTESVRPIAAAQAR